MTGAPPHARTFLLLTDALAHKVARELEDPFVYPPNDLPSGAMQYAFNDRLMSTWDGLRCRHNKSGRHSDTGRAVIVHVADALSTTIRSATCSRKI